MTGLTTRQAECRMCARVEDEQGPEGGWILRTDDWAAYGLPDCPIPGCIVLQSAGHYEGLAAMDPRDAAVMALMTRWLSRGLTAVGAGEPVYCYWLGEQQRHFHLILVAAAFGSDTGARGRALLQRVLARDPALVDAQRATGVRVRLRAFLADSSDEFARQCRQVFADASV